MGPRTLDLFVDTSGWAEYHVADAPHHRAADAAIKRWRTSGRRARLVTTNYVLAELASLLVSPLRVRHSARIAILGAIRSARWVEIVHVTQEVDRRAWDLLARREDKDWSLVGCSSFVIMQDRGIRDALTTDHHFAQAGSGRLLA